MVYAKIVGGWDSMAEKRHDPSEAQAVATFLPFPTPIHIGRWGQVNDLRQFQPGQLTRAAGSVIIGVAGDPEGAKLMMARQRYQ